MFGLSSTLVHTYYLVLEVVVVPDIGVTFNNLGGGTAAP